MADEPSNDLSTDQLKEVEFRLTKGYVHRAGLVAWVFCVTFSVYGVNSFPFIKVFHPDLTLFDNLWPRILFNAVPFAVMGYYFFFKSSTRVYLKAYLWSFLFPITFMAACLIYVWPIMYEGRSLVYTYVHAANTMVISTGFIFSAPPMYFACITLGSIVAFIFAPVAWLLYRTGDTLVLNMFANDMVLFSLASLYAGYTSHQLRRKLAIMEVRNRSKVEKFVGSIVKDAIFEGRADLLKDRTREGVVLAIDLRGFTAFTQSVDPLLSKNVMEAYHQAVSRIIGGLGAYLHKSSGDGHLITFGIMNEEADLSDIPGLENEERLATERKHRSHIEHAIHASQEIAKALEIIKADHGTTFPLRAGIAVDFGPVHVGVRGDGNHRLELDLSGEVVIRATRLESYTKFIGSELIFTGSLLIVAPEAQARLSHSDQDVFETFQVGSNPVRDFASIQEIKYLRLGTPTLGDLEDPSLSEAA